MAKVKIVKKTLKDSNLAEMFNQMLGGDGDPEIIVAKQTKIRGLMKTVVTPKHKQYLLLSISMMFNKCREIHRIVTSPDIDVKKFSNVIIESIEKVKGVPELNRCNEAFNKIRDSVKLLEDNFSDYYKDM